MFPAGVIPGAGAAGLPSLTLGGAAGPSYAGLTGENGAFNASGKSINFSGTQEVRGTQAGALASGGLNLTMVALGLLGLAAVYLAVRK